MMPRSYDDILKRGAAFRLYAERTLGLVGRTPDFLNTMLMAFAGSPEVFEEMGPQFAENLQRYFRYVRDNDLFLTHALVTPQTDRSKPPSQQRGEFLHMGVVREPAGHAASPSRAPVVSSTRGSGNGGRSDSDSASAPMFSTTTWLLGRLVVDRVVGPETTRTGSCATTSTSSSALSSQPNAR